MVNNADFQRQKPTYQRVLHMRYALHAGGYTRELLVGYCTSGCDIGQSFFIARILLNQYGKWREAQGRGKGAYVEPSEVHDAIYAAFANETEDYMREYFADMIRHRDDAPELSAAQQQVVAQHAFVSPALDSPEFLRLSNLLGYEIALEARLLCATCGEPLDFARVLVTLWEAHPERLKLTMFREARNLEPFQPFLPPSARGQADNVRDHIDTVCIQRGYPLPRLRNRGRKAKD